MEVLRDSSNYIRLDFSLDEQKSKCNPTPQQRAVYNFHEARHSNEAEDIYASEWFDRTEDFLEHVRPDAQSTILSSWDTIENLEFGRLFLAHPIPGYSLWRFLHACCELDNIICGCASNISWANFKPFLYMESDDIQLDWSKSLDNLRTEIETGVLQGERLLRKLHAIFCAVEKLDSTFNTLDETFRRSLGEKKFIDRMMDTILIAYDWRRDKIAKLSFIQDNEYTSRSVCESPSEEDLISSKELKPKARNPSRGRNRARGKKRRRASKQKKEDARLLHPKSITPHAYTWPLGSVTASSVLLLWIVWAIYNVKKKI